MAGGVIAGQDAGVPVKGSGMGTLDKVASGAASAARGLLRALGRGAGPAPAAPARIKVPDWYRPHPAPETLRALESGKPAFLYMPWIAEHTDALIARLGHHPDFQLVASDMFLGLSDDPTRREIFRVALEETELYRRLVQRRLVQLRPHLRGVIFTFDWAPVTRVVAEVCGALGLPKILVPHESVFIHRDKYYWCANGKASVPVGDVILGWGRLQKEIFVDRGYPAERFRTVGAPKFDPYANYTPRLDRAAFCSLYGLDPQLPLILFATQPLDSQLDTAMALKLQQQAVADVFAYAEARGCQLLVRLPPSKDETLGSELRARLRRSPLGAVDEAQCYLVPPEEALFHADVVTSINSTMLFEAVLLGRPALSLKYLEFDQIWAQVGIPAVRDAAQLGARLDALLAEGWTASAEGLAWAADMFGTGHFDGCAAARIGDFLSAVARGEEVIVPLPPARERLFAGEPVDLVATPAVPEFSAAQMPHLLALFGARGRGLTPASATNLRAVASADIFLQWGKATEGAQAVQAEIARALGRPVVTVERGLIGAASGISSVLLDDGGAPSDSTRPSRLERWLASGPELLPDEQARARRLIDTIIAAQVSGCGKERAAPFAVGTPGRRKLLVLAQATAEPTLPASSAQGEPLARMLAEIAAAHGDCDILLKGAVDPAAALPPQVVVVDAGLHALLDVADEVFTVSDPAGFLALLRGKQVHCFGAPFYAGWGLTQDHLPLPRRGRARSVEDLAHVALILQARYVDPSSGRPLTAEAFIEALPAPAEGE